jgi:hypothetical protein
VISKPPGRRSGGRFAVWLSGIAASTVNPCLVVTISHCFLLGLQKRGSPHDSERQPPAAGIPRDGAACSIRSPPDRITLFLFAARDWLRAEHLH